MTFRAIVSAAWLAVLALSSPGALAWWNADWSTRTTVRIDTTEKGLKLGDAAAAPVVALRLHSGNFDFAAAQPDGGDLRVVGADDKTPLPFTVERYDTVNELAVLWVRVPGVLPASDANVFHVYAGNAKAAAEPAANVFGAPHLFVAHFSEAGGPAVDAVAQRASAGAAERDAGGLLAGSLRIAGAPLQWAAEQAPRLEAGAPMTLSLWLKPDAVAQGTLVGWGPLKLRVDKGRVVVDGASAPLSGGTLAAGAWAHVAVVAANGSLRLYVAGELAAETAASGTAALPALAGPLAIGEGLPGLFDELEIAGEARSPAQLRLAAASEGPDSGFVKTVRKTGDTEAGPSHGYIGVLVGNLTSDAWVVIGILAAMFVVAVWVMATKTLAVLRIDRGNRRFLQSFRGAPDGGFGAAPPAPLAAHSSLERLYRTGLVELGKRHEARRGLSISAASFNAVKAVLDADLVRENHTLNARMVLLTIAISGGPFLGLLGTVVGVMITFAAIAAAGDVNVNAIAPGIAAALLATVAGLGVAIPALFGYNWLASRIRNISADMQIFVDEFITRAAETYGRR